jgi:protoporphyrinogen oxidase
MCRGYQRELESMGNRVLTDAPVTAIEHSEGRVTGVRYRQDGVEHFMPATQVIATAPLTSLVRMTEPKAPPEVTKAADSLTHRSMIFVYLILNRPKVTDDHWIYLPEKRLTTHRLSEFKNFSPDAAPKDKTLLCAEITCNFGDEHWNRTDKELETVVVKDLTESIGLIKADEVLHTFSRRERYAYPIYDLSYRGHRDVLLEYVDKLVGLDTTGRQGLFKYNNMDHSIGMGLAIAENVLGRGKDHRSVASGQEYFG